MNIAHFFKNIFSLIILIVSAKSIQAQKAPQTSQPVYPRVTGYVGIVHPLVTFIDGETHTNFDGSYTVGFPAGINLWKTAKVGFSAEFVPYIHAENGTSKMNNFLFHPGILLPLGKGYTFVGRAAFETSGRYGLTPIINKVIKKNAHSNYYVAIPVPARFGNDRPASLTLALQLGFAF